MSAKHPTTSDNDWSLLLKLAHNTAEIAAGGGSGGGIPDAPSDGNAYNRKDAAWVRANPGAYDLGAQSGNFTPDLANGNKQYCWLNGNLTLFGPSGSEDAYPKEMDTFEFLIQWASGNYTLDFSGIQYPTDLSGVLPVTLEQYRSYLVTLRFQGGQWCLFAVHGPFVESVD